MMRKYLLMLAAVVALLVSCHESLEKRAQREAWEYTEKNCPTPWTNSVRTDSVVFDIPTRTYTYFCCVNGKMDNEELIKAHWQNISDGLREEVAANTGLKAYKEAGFCFRYLMYSNSKPRKLLYNITISPNDYNTDSARR